MGETNQFIIKTYAWIMMLMSMTDPSSIKI